MQSHVLYACFGIFYHLTFCLGTLLNMREISTPCLGKTADTNYGIFYGGQIYFCTYFEIGMHKEVIGMLVLLIVYDGLQASINYMRDVFIALFCSKFIVDFFPFDG